jgi:hypothetical protein
MGLYLIYWYISNTHKLKDYSKKDDLIWIRTFGIFIPLVNFYFLWEFFDSVKKEASNHKVRVNWNPGWVLVGVIFIGGIINGIYQEVLGSPGGYWALLFYLLFVFGLSYPLELVQDTLNDYFYKKEIKNKVKIKYFLTAGEIIFTIGSWILIYFIFS